jgi:hypothetical protein
MDAWALCTHRGCKAWTVALAVAVGVCLFVCLLCSEDLFSIPTSSSYQASPTIVFKTRTHRMGIGAGVPTADDERADGRIRWCHPTSIYLTIIFAGLGKERYGPISMQSECPTNVRVSACGSYSPLHLLSAEGTAPQHCWSLARGQTLQQCCFRCRAPNPWLSGVANVAKLERSASVSQSTTDLE